MTENKKKLKKVILEYDNGEKNYLEGDDAQTWLEVMNSAIVNDFIHGGKKNQEILKKLSWKKEIWREYDKTDG